MFCKTPATWILSSSDQTITFGDRTIQLRKAEHRILQCLAAKAPQAVSAPDLITGALSGRTDGTAARRQIHEIRRKLKAIAAEHLLVTEWGGGYRLSLAPDDHPPASSP